MRSAQATLEEGPWSEFLEHLFTKAFFTSAFTSTHKFSQIYNHFLQRVLHQFLEKFMIRLMSAHKSPFVNLKFKSVFCLI